VLDTNPERFRQFAENVWNTGSAEAGIEKTVMFFRELGMPVSLGELGLGELDDRSLDALADSCTFGRTRTIGSFRVLDYDDIRRIYAWANR
jgi:alcohol dehydrogenase YqhD (iron-dependent ADH family)